MKTRFVGDIHGKFTSYKEVIADCEQSIQVGDFGFGFNYFWDEVVNLWQQENPQHRFIRGNHDSPAVCRASPNFIHDGSVEQHTMFVGGAWSIDWAGRIEGVSWWRDEELNYDQFQRVISTYEIMRPRVMITHDFPEKIISAGKSFSDVRYKTITGQALEVMLNIHKPELWIAGHWHSDEDQVIDGTRFICLNELSHVDVDLETLEVTKPEQFGSSMWSLEDNK